MSKANKMIQAMDQLQITQKPYKAHYLTECDQTIRQQYLQLLFSVVSLEGFNDAQQRIWQLLSQSIGVDGTSSDEMNSELIQSVVQNCVENKLQHVFVLDLLVLLRLNTVSDEQAHILAELISLFALSDQDVDTLIHLSDLILSISDKGQNLSEFKYETIRHWHEFSYQILTKELLIAGLNGGRWIQLNDITEVNKPITINSSSLYCMDEKVISVSDNPIKVKGSQFDVNLKAEDCTLEILETNFANQIIELLGDKNSAFFEDCNFVRVFEASYDDPIYLNCPKGYLKLNQCNFQMENIATINFSGTRITVENSTFEKCGNSKGRGCINIYSHFECKLVKNKFNYCVSKDYGAAITVHRESDYLNLNHCEFIECVGEKIDGINNLGVYFCYKQSRNFITHCVFNLTNLALNVTQYTESKISSSNFMHAYILANNSSRIKFESCNFENDGKVNIVELPSLLKGH